MEISCCRVSIYTRARVYVIWSETRAWVFSMPREKGERTRDLQMRLIRGSRTRAWHASLLLFFPALFWDTHTKTRTYGVYIYLIIRCDLILLENENARCGIYSLEDNVYYINGTLGAVSMTKIESSARAVCFVADASRCSSPKQITLHFNYRGARGLSEWHSFSAHSYALDWRGRSLLSIV